MLLFWIIVGVLMLILIFGYVAYYFRTQPQQKPNLQQEPARENLTVMVRDPYCLFAYWDLSQKTVDELKKKQEQLVLRVYKLDESEHLDTKRIPYFDIQVTPEADNWYIKNLEAGRAYILEIGKYLDDGAFVPLARSRKVHTPHDGPGKIDPQWQPVAQAWHGATRYQLGTASEYMAERND